MKSKHSSDKTKKRAENIAQEIGSVHSEVEIDDMRDLSKVGMLSLSKDQGLNQKEGI